MKKLLSIIFASAVFATFMFGIAYVGLLAGAVWLTFIGKYSWQVYFFWYMITSMVSIISMLVSLVIAKKIEQHQPTERRTACIRNMAPFFALMQNFGFRF